MMQISDVGSRLGRIKSLAGIKRKHQETEEHDSEVEDPGVQEGQQTAAYESDDEVEYYRQAVGQEPDEGK